VNAYDQVADIIAILLHSVAQELGKPQEYISIEVESVITRSVLEAFKRGSEFIHTRATEPPRKETLPYGSFSPVGKGDKDSNQSS